MGVLGVGFGAYVPAQVVAAILPVDSHPVKAVIREAQAQGKVLDASRGRKTLSMIRLVNGDVVLSSISPETLAKRLEAAMSGTELARQARFESEVSGKHAAHHG